MAGAQGGSIHCRGEGGGGGITGDDKLINASGKEDVRAHTHVHTHTYTHVLVCAATVHVV